MTFSCPSQETSWSPEEESNPHCTCSDFSGYREMRFCH